MKFTPSVFLLLIGIAVSSGVYADKVYKSTNEKGNVEFSDRKSPGAKKVKVKPNVVNIKTPQMPETTEGKKLPQKESAQPQEVIEGRQGTATAGNLKRRIRYSADGEKIEEARDKREKRKQLKEHSDKIKEKGPVKIQPIRQPGARQGGARAGGGR